MGNILRSLIDPFLRREWSYRLLICVPILPGTSYLFRLRERCHRLRLKSRGEGGYLQDTWIIFPKNVSIGDRVTCGGRVYIDGSAELTIGSDTMIAYGAIITTASHDPSAEIMNRMNQFSSVVIGNNVWIGAGAKVLPGVKLADGIVVASGSVVTKSFLEPDVIIAGVPAKLLRHRKSDRPTIYEAGEMAEEIGEISR